jgi:hypothetical protein
MAMFKRNVALHLGCLAFLLSATSASWGSDGLFQAPQSYKLDGWYAMSLAVADVNGDGKPDLLVANGCCSAEIAGGVVGVLLGNGDGTFQAVQSYYSGGYLASSIAVGDVNGDGKPDLIVADGRTNSYDVTGLVGVLLGNGDGTFQTAQTYYSGGLQAISVAVGDVNGDGKLDLIVGNEYTGGVSVLLGNGDGTFQSPVVYAQDGGSTKSIAVADVNGDHRADVLVAINGCLGVLLGNGDGTFQPLRTYNSGGTRANSIAVSDVNGDGKLDLLVANLCSAQGCGHGGGVGVLLGNGDGTFQPAQSYNPRGYRTGFIAVADVNGDGKPDLLAANSLFNKTRGSVGVLLGNGDGTFQAAQTYQSGDGANSLALADVNGDGQSDLLVATQCFGHYCDSRDFVSVLLGRFNTITALNSNLNPSIYGQLVTFAASVSSGSPKVPTGTVTFRNGSKSIGQATLSGGVTTLTTKALAAGTWSVTATYNGNPESIKSTSAPLSQGVSQASTTTTIKSSVNPSAQRQSVTFTAKVASPTVRATGTVTFTAGPTTLGIVPLSGGRAILTTSALPQGANTITAAYDGNDNIMGSTASLTQIVN